jgi:hypothetical protein
MGKYWKTFFKIGYTTPSKYIFAIASEMMLMVFPLLFLERTPYHSFFSSALIFNAALVLEYLLKPSIFEDEEKIKNRYVSKSIVNMSAILVAIWAFQIPYILLLPLLVHRIHFEINIWAQRKLLSFANNAFLVLSLALYLFLGLTSNNPDGITLPLFYVAFAATLISGFSAQMSGKMLSRSEKLLESKDMILTLNQMVLSSLKHDIRTELGPLEEASGDPDLEIPPVLRGALQKKWAALEDLLKGTHSSYKKKTVDMRTIMRLVSKASDDRCEVVVTYWGECKARINGSLLSSLMRSLAKEASRRAGEKKTTVWVTVLTNRILITDDSGSSEFDPHFVHAVTSPEFKEISGLQVEFETPTNVRAKGISGAKIAIII